MTGCQRARLTTNPPPRRRRLEQDFSSKVRWDIIRNHVPYLRPAFRYRSADVPVDFIVQTGGRPPTVFNLVHPLGLMPTPDGGSWNTVARQPATEKPNLATLHRPLHALNDTRTISCGDSQHLAPFSCSSSCWPTCCVPAFLWLVVLGPCPVPRPRDTHHSPQLELPHDLKHTVYIY